MAEGNQKAILVVEDEEGIRNAYVKILQRAGFAVDAATTVPEAKAMLDTKAFDLVITDVEMPGEGNGVDLVAHIRGKGWQMPVIVNSANAAEGVVREIKTRLSEIGGDTVFLQKPLSLIVLKEKVNAMLGITPPQAAR